MHIVAEQHLVQLQHVRIVGKHDVAGMIEGEALVFDRAAPAADARVLVEQQRVLVEVIGRAQAGRAGRRRSRIARTALPALLDCMLEFRRGFAAAVACIRVASAPLALDRCCSSSARALSPQSCPTKSVPASLRILRACCALLRPAAPAAPLRRRR